MRQIERDTLAAIGRLIEGKQRGNKWSSGNTAASIDEDGTVTVQLHGSAIARIMPRSGQIATTLAGYGTRTTRSRCNAILTALAADAGGYHQHQRSQYYNGQPTDTHAWHIERLKLPEQ